MASENESSSLLAEREKRRAALTSVFAAILLVGIKLAIGLATGSLGILAEAAHSGLDFVAAAVTLLAVRASGKPADRAHTYGHGKVENFSALVETLLLFVTCAWIIYEAIHRLFIAPVHVDPSIWAFLVMAVSIVVDLSRSRLLYRTARKHNSQALEADALHFSTDIWSSSVVIGGLLLVWIGRSVLPSQGQWLFQADAVAALGVAFIVLFVSYNLGKRTIDMLLDRAPEGLPEKIAGAAAEVAGVLSVGQVRVRGSGPRTFVDMTIEVDRNIAFERVHAITEDVEARVREISPGADVVIHTDPREAERESLARRIRAIADRNQMPVHNVSVHDDRGELHVDFHLEVDDHLSVGQAHELASHLEDDVRRDVPGVKRVNVHIESRGTGVGSGADVTAANPALVEKVCRIADQVSGPGSCHNVLIRRNGDKLAVSLHCHFPSDLSVMAAHDLSSRIEKDLKDAVPALDRVLVHVEPGHGDTPIAD